MRTLRLRRLAAACRLSSIVVLFLFGILQARTFAQTSIDGIVVDATGRPLPRAMVSVNGSSLFTSENGRFHFTAAPGPKDPAYNNATCEVRVTLTGFNPQTAACRSGEPLRIVLTLAPIHESIVVSATRTEAPLGQVGASATVFNEQDLEHRQMPLVAELLRLTPGAMVITNGGRGGITSLFVRGGESDYNKVLLDGVPLNDPGGNFYFNNLTTENIERVEVVRGAYSSLFGSDAMASVIQLFTKRADDGSRKPHVSAQVDGGTYDTLHMNTAVAGARGALDYSLGVARFSTDNRVPNNRFENNTFSANVGVAVNEQTTLRFIGRSELERVGTPGQTAFGRPDMDAFFDRDDVLGAVTFDQQITAGIRQRASYSLALSNQQSTNLIADPSFTATFPGHTATYQSSDFTFDSRTDYRRHHAHYQVDWRVNPGTAHGEHLFTVLGDWDGERATLENRLAATSTDASRDNFGGSAQYQMIWSRLFVTVGGRVEKNDSFGTEAVPRATAVAVLHQASPMFGETRMKASIGKGIKEPSIPETFSLSFFSKGNPDLKPERSRSAEVGIEQRLANDRARVEVTYFDNKFRDLIWTQTTDFTTFAGQYFNLVGLSQARGLEFDTDVAPVPSLHARAGYTFLDSTIEQSHADTVVFTDGAWAFRRPRHSGFVGATVEWNRLVADVSGLWIGRFVDSDFFLFSPPIVEIPAHTTWDARVMVRVTPQLTAIVTVDNLTNRDYMQPVGYQSLQRAIRAGVRVGW